jgi:hypothetical protein
VTTHQQNVYFHTNFNQHLEYHVYISVDGNVFSILCYTNRDSNEVITCRQIMVNDVIPRFKRLLFKRQYPMLIVATKVQIIDTNVGSREGGRCGHVNFGGVFQYDEYGVMAHNLYNTNRHMVLPYFGIYVGKNAKLLFVDACRKCAAKSDEQVHHNRTLFQSGAFLIVEGDLCFQFAKYFDNFYSARDLEVCGIIRDQMITGKQNPIFFLREIETCVSIMWCLGPIEHKEEDRHWVLCIPDGGQFNAIEPYSTGVNQVMYLQTRTPQPWSDNEETDHNYVRPQQSLNFSMSPEFVQNMEESRNRNEANINWNNVQTLAPPQQPPKQCTPIPQHLPINQFKTDNLPLGTVVMIPYEYQLVGPLAQHLFDSQNYSEYYVINKFWYRRVNYDTLPLRLQHFSSDGLPDYLKHQNAIQAYATHQFHVMVFDDQPNQLQHYVVVFYWQSYTKNVIKKKKIVTDENIDDDNEDELLNT